MIDTHYLLWLCSLVPRPCCARPAPRAPRLKFGFGDRNPAQLATKGGGERRPDAKRSAPS